MKFPNIITDEQCSITLPTVNSLSGGRTSSYIAAHYPADIDVFALVCIDCHNAAGKIDKKLRQMANDRLQKYCSHWPEFIATSEDPVILRTIFDLEQHTGREITWLRGMSWEQMITYKKAIPNQQWRFCSYMLKILPIFEFLYSYRQLPVSMRIGYRYDEMERVNDFTEEIKFAQRMELRGQSGWQHRWEKITWRTGEFPLVEDRITHFHVMDYWKDKTIPFPQDSNCQMCFWKQPQQLRKNFDTNPNVMAWAGVQEVIHGNTFRKELSMFDAAKIGIQLDFNFGTGSGCQAGFCTD